MYISKQIIKIHCCLYKLLNVLFFSFSETGRLMLVSIMLKIVCLHIFFPFVYFYEWCFLHRLGVFEKGNLAGQLLLDLQLLQRPILMCVM